MCQGLGEGKWGVNIYRDRISVWENAEVPQMEDGDDCISM